MSKGLSPLVQLKNAGLAAVAASLFLSFAPPANAVENTAILVGVKTLSMLSRTFTGPIVMGIVYDPADAESKSNAEAMKTVLDSGVRTPDGESVSGLLVPLPEINKLSQVQLAFLSSGVKDHYDRIAQIAASHNILTMSSDMECVRSNKCVLGIISSPIVEIYFSRSASETAKIDFDPAFLMLIKKV